METTPIPQNRDNTELVEAIRELRGYEKKNLRINRIRLIISAVGLVICIALAVFVYRNVGSIVKKADTALDALTDAGNNINTLSEEIEKMDLEKLGKSLGNIVDISEETIGEIHQAVGGLDQLVKDADDAMQHINSVDFENLNNGIQSLNDVLEPVANFFNVFKR
ncbi:MAG: hypothetical protein IJK54_08385 [Clostridia bacterium]|nr:hypothetical protein [Clostridia bacterium]